VSEHETSSETLGEPTRRDFLYLATGMAGVVGAGAVAWPFIDQMRPDASTLALASIEVDVSSLQPGMSLTAKWRGKPVFIRNRTEKEVEEANAVALGDLKDPVARNANLPADAQATDVDRSAGKDKENWIVHASRLRSARPGWRFRWLVLSVPRLALRYGRPYP
jgi:ubiquinol-cytochrome c reductase iron-sulfur subunit